MTGMLSAAEQTALIENYAAFAKKYPVLAPYADIRNSIYKLDRLEGLNASIKLEQMKLGALEQESYQAHLEEAYRRGYLTTHNNLPNTNAFFGIDKDLMALTINQKWCQGKNFGNRIWNNKEQLTNYIQNDLRDGLAAGASYSKMAKQLSKRFDVSTYKSKRLVFTESSFVLEQANARAFIDAGVVAYQICAILDAKTSAVCRHMDNEIFMFEHMSVGVNFPPFHVWCRTTIIPLLDNYLGTRPTFTEFTSFDNPLENLTDSWYNGLTEYQKGVLDSYTQSGHRIINSCLRGEREFKGIKTATADLDSALSSYKLPVDTVFWRGVTGKEAELIKSKVGGEFKDYKSVAAIKKKAGGFQKMYDGGVMIKMNVPAGTRGAYIGSFTSYMSNESEFLLGRGMKYKVINVTDEFWEVDIYE